MNEAQGGLSLKGSGVSLLLTELLFARKKTMFPLPSACWEAKSSMGDREVPEKGKLGLVSALDTSHSVSLL